MSDQDNLTLDQILKIGNDLPKENWRRTAIPAGGYRASNSHVGITTGFSVYTTGKISSYFVSASSEGYDVGEYYFDIEGKSVGNAGERGDERIKEFYERRRQEVEQLEPIRRQKALEAARRLADS